MMDQRHHHPQEGKVEGRKRTSIPNDVLERLKYAFGKYCGGYFMPLAE